MCFVIVVACLLFALLLVVVALFRVYLLVLDDSVAKLSSEARLAEAVEGLLSVIIRGDLEASSAVLALHLPAVPASAVVILAKGAIVVVVTGAELSPVSLEATGSSVLAVVLLAVRALLSGGSEGDGAQAQEHDEDRKAVHGCLGLVWVVERRRR